MRTGVAFFLGQVLGGWSVCTYLYQQHLGTICFSQLWTIA